jgi:hypothetical protein
MEINGEYIEELLLDLNSRAPYGVYWKCPYCGKPIEERISWDN